MSLKDGVYLDIKIPYDSGADASLREKVISSLREKYCEPLPETVGVRISKELYLTEHFGFAPAYLTHGEVVKSVKSILPCVLFSANAASLIEFALGVTETNPLPPHYRCEKCNCAEFVTDNVNGASLPPAEKSCPVCGEKLYLDGCGLAFESFTGLRHDKTPSLAIGVTSERFEEALSFLENKFGAVRKDIKALSRPFEDGFCHIEIFVVPTDGLPAEKKAFAVCKADDPAVYEYLSRPESYGCYLPYEDEIPAVKELLECVEVKDFSDLRKVCGLVHSSAWLPYILPSIKNRSVGYRDIITAREDIYEHLTELGIADETAYKVMEAARKGRAAKLFEDTSLLGALKELGVTEEYVERLKNIKYIVTRAQGCELASAAYKLASLRLCGN